MMGKYYRSARNLVWQYGGMLDKFIGDAVLGVFGYPQGPNNSASNAIRFSLDLIKIGANILGEWKRMINAKISSGTRVGISTGDGGPINSGGEHGIHLTIFGDTVNLSARLEKNCDVNGVLFDNRTKAKAEEEDLNYIKSVEFAEREIPPADAKGQTEQIIAWQIKPIV